MMPVCDFWRVVLLLTVGGCMGGLLYWTSIYLSTIKPNSDFPVPGAWTGNLWFCVANLFTGIGGAWAAVLTMLVANHAPTGNNTKELLELLGTCVLAGYAGNRLLPAAAERLSNELLKQTAARTQANAESAKIDADAAGRSRLVAEVLAYLDDAGSQTEHQTDTYVQQLKTELASDPQFRQGAILLARIYDEQKKDPVAAVDVLLAFIDGKRKAGAKDDSDIADAYWNLANYYEEQFKAEPTKRAYRDSAIEALSESLRIVPSYRESLKSDADFRDLVSDNKAAKLLI